MPFFYKVGIKARNDGEKGLYALEPIPKGAIIWKLQVDQGDKCIPVEGLQKPRPCLFFTDEQIQALTDQSLLRDIAHCAYNKKSNENLYVLARDGFQFQNHSDDPNIRVSQIDDTEVTIRDIAEGEEIFHDYNQLGVLTKTFQKLMAKYDKQSYQFTIDAVKEKHRIIPLGDL